MKYFLTLLFVLLSTQLWAAENKQTYFCLSASDGSQKLLVLAEIDGVLYYGECEEEGYPFNQQVLIVPVTTAPRLSDRFDKGDIVLVEKNVDSGINQVTHLKSCPNPEE